MAGSIVIEHPNTSGQLTFNILEDMVPEGEETVFVQMGVVIGATIGTPQTQIILIQDNDLNRDTAGLSFCITFPGNRDVAGITDPQLLELFIVGEPLAPATQITGTVSVGAIGFSQAFTVQSGTVTTITVPTEAAVRTSDIVEANKAIMIDADGPITVYGLNSELSALLPGAGSSDGFLAFPEQTLGVDYLILANAGIGNQFTVVGCADGTIVTITPTIDIVPGILQGTSGNGTHLAGVPYNVTLNRGDVYQIRHGIDDDGDFTGTSVVASAPIAVFGGDLCGEVPYDVQFCDHLVEQITPTESWGKSYQTMPFKNRMAEVYRFLASEDNTQVDVSREDPPGSGTIVTTTVATGLMRGEFVEFFNGGPKYIYSPGAPPVLNPDFPKPPVPLDIQASAPLLASQLIPGTKFDSVLGDPAMMNLAWFEQYVPTYTIATPLTGFDTHFLNLIVSDLDTENVLLNGFPLSSFTATPFTPIGSSGFSGMQLQIPPGAYTLKSSLPMSVYVYGYAQNNSYAYSAGLNLAAVAKVTGITLEPGIGAPAPVGGEHCVVATIEDATGAAVFGVRVDFFVQGANQAIGFDFADENGKATFCYTGTFATGAFGGADLIEARVGTLFDTATMTWTDGESANPPTLEFTSNQILEAVSAAGAPAILNAKAGDIDGDAVLVEWRVNGNLVQTETVLAAPGLPTGPSALSYTDTFPLGVNNIDVSATDGLAPPIGPQPIADVIRSGTVTVVDTIAPTAVDDYASTAEDVAVVIDVLANDTDIFTPLTVDSVNQPASGGVVVNNGSNVTFTPAPNFYGVVVFTYVVSDANGNTSTATVTVDVSMVLAPPTAVDDSATIVENSGLLTLNLTSNDTDPEGDLDPTSLVITQGASSGVLVNNGDGSINYTPALDFSGVEIIKYRVSDLTGLVSNEATVTITVTPINTVPQANPDVAATDEDSPVIIASVLANDDLGDLPTTLTSFDVTSANGGVVVDNGGGSFIYTPALNFNGVDTFNYTITDNDGEISATTVTITVAAVNDAPDAVDNSYTTPEDTPVSGNAIVDNTGAGVDSDVDGDTLVVTTVGTFAMANGSVTIAADGSFTYTPNANYNGPDSFSYTITDGNGETSSGTVNINVTPVNDVPLANPDSAATNEDEPVTTGNVLTNDDLGDEPTTITASDATSANGGTVVNNGDGTFTYTPAPDFNGTDTFTYAITDDDGETSTATVTIAVAPANDSPVAQNDVVSTNEDTAVTGSVLVNNGNGGDGDPDGDTLTVTTVGTFPTANGSVTIAANGAFTYTPAANFCGVDTFTYTITDGNGGSDSATVTVNVICVNDLPVAANDSAVTDEDTPVTIIVLGNDGDVDGDTLTVVSAGPAGNGSVTVNPDGTVTYTPNVNFCGVDTFNYTVSDGNGGTAPATVAITVNCVNDAPIAIDNAYTTDQDTPVSGNVISDNTGVGVDSDPDGDALTAATTPVVGPNNGVVVINPDGSFTYTPNAGFTGTDSFIYQISDGNGGTAVATVTITVTPTGPTDCAACDGKVTTLTLRYDGPGTVNIKIVQQKGEIAFDGTVSSGGTFAAIGQAKWGTLSPKVKVYINGVLDTEIHTSCSVPIGPGQVWGSFTIIEGFSRNGGRLCPVDGGGDDDGKGGKDDDGKDSKAGDDGKDSKSGDDGKDSKSSDDGKDSKSSDDGKSSKSSDDSKSSKSSNDGKSSSGGKDDGKGGK